VSYLRTVYFTRPDVRGFCERASDPFSPGASVLLMPRGASVPAEAGTVPFAEAGTDSAQ
jgi:hypothetical protein